MPIFLVDAIVCDAHVFFSFLRINNLQVRGALEQQIFQTEAMFSSHD